MVILLLQQIIRLITPFFKPIIPKYNLEIHAQKLLRDFDTKKNNNE